VTRNVRVDVISDVVCPWCFVGKRRLEAAAALLKDVALDVHWHPFQLDGTIPDGGISRETYLMNKFGTRERIAEIYTRVAAAGVEEGIAFAFDKITVSPNTLNAHRLIRWAGEAGHQDAMKERLFDAYFLEGANLADDGVLANLAAEIGLDRDMVAARLASDSDIAAVKAEIANAHRIGVTGVPFFIFNGKLALAGAHPAATIANGIRQALAA
jgi:predicted DsbA family dithiol-disulfide isomerase